MAWLGIFCLQSFVTPMPRCNIRKDGLSQESNPHQWSCTELPGPFEGCSADCSIAPRVVESILVLGFFYLLSTQLLVLMMSLVEVQHNRPSLKIQCLAVQVGEKQTYFAQNKEKTDLFAAWQSHITFYLLSQDLQTSLGSSNPRFILSDCLWLTCKTPIIVL